MYEYASDPQVRSVKRVFEKCHDLNLLRCYESSQMKPKLDAIAADFGSTEVCGRLARQTAEWIVATGDRLVHSPCDVYVPSHPPINERGYHPQRFPECSKKPETCLTALGLLTTTTSAPPPPPPPDDMEQPAPPVEMEHAVRFHGSRYNQLHAAQMLKWKLTEWKADENAVDANRKFIKEKLQLVLRVYCKAHPHAGEDKEDSVARGANASSQLLQMAEISGELVEHMAMRLWTSGGNSSVDGRELCSILNEVIRLDGKLPGTPSGNAPADLEEPEEDASVLLTAATSVICMLQFHLNQTRRTELAQPSYWPEGPSGDGESNTKEANTTYRGGGLPVKYIPFYQALAGKDRLYRIPGLLATSFRKAKARGFMSRAKDDPKVLWTIKLKDPDDYGYCKHVSFLEKTAFNSEKEFLFSAYSCFKVLAVKPSPNPKNSETPHEIVIEACVDNSEMPENVPSAPWY